MKRADHPATSAEVRMKEAVHWFLLLKDREPSLDVLRRWQEWSRDEENRKTFDVVTKVWCGMDEIGPVALPTQEELALDDDYELDPQPEQVARGGSQNVAQLSPAAHRPAPEQAARGESQNVAATQNQRGRVGVRKGLTLVAMVVTSVLLLGWYFGSGSFHTPDVPQQVYRYQTATAEHRTLSLPDGSVLKLGAQSTASVVYAPERRTVVLERGEAMFEVAKDAKRPFVVQAGNGTVTALGTVFSVRYTEDRVVVSVAEGKVAVAERSSSEKLNGLESWLGASTRESPATVLVRGEQISYDNTGRLGPKIETDPQYIAARGEGRLHYLAEPLKDVVRDVNRYTNKPIVFTERVVDGLRYTGSVQSQDIEDWLRGLEAIYPEIDVLWMQDQYILVPSGSNQPIQARTP